MSGSKGPTLVGVSLAERRALKELQSELNEGLPATFEELSARLFSRLLDVPIVVASSGYQFGADAGTVGLRGRNLRIECKRYLETTSASARSLKGQVEEAAQADSSLEAWVLMSTKTIPEMDQTGIKVAGESRGLPAIVIDWNLGTGKLPRLACLCSAYPDEVEALYGEKAANAARVLTASGATGVAAQRADLQPWAIGFKEVRVRSLAKVENIWTKKNESLARLNQNAAGGSSGVLIHRAGPTIGLEGWWKSPQPCGPAAIHGPEGHGKTWALLDWLTLQCDKFPVVLTFAATSIGNEASFDEDALLNLLGRGLQALGEGPLEHAYWRRRAERLLSRPSSEPAAILLVIDGLNQNPSAPWNLLVRVSQGERLRKGLRLAFTVRTSFLRNQKEFEPLADRIVSIPVGPYSAGPGGEREQALKAHGIDETVLHPGLLAHATVPRVLPLIGKLKDNIALQSDSTVHRVLWEYGLDEHRLRTDASFTPEAFEEWVSERAREWRTCMIEQREVKAMSRNELAGSVSSAETSTDEVARRLSDLIDGRWVLAESGNGRAFSAPPQTLLLGLAVAVLDLLRDAPGTTIQAKLDELEGWLEPIAAFDEAAEVLRAALAILTAKPLNANDLATTSALMTAWLYAQNPTKDLEHDVVVLGTQLPISLLDAMERSKADTHAHPLGISAQALRRVPVARTADWLEIESRLEQWCARLVCPRPEDVQQGPNHYAASQAQRMAERIGTSSPGECTVLGVPVSIRYAFDSNVFHVAASVLEGHSIQRMERPFIAAALAVAVRASHYHHAWDGFKALSLFCATPDLNVRDALRAWSTKITTRVPEKGVSDQLAARVAALLLRASGEVVDEAKARAIDTELEHARTYVDQYELDPAHSGFELEFRHIDQQLNAVGLPMISRLNRLSKLLGDPTVKAEASVIDELEVMSAKFPVDEMDSRSQRTINEFHFEETEPGMARFNPAALAVLVRRRLSAMATRGPSAKYWAALRAREYMLLVTPDIAEQLETYRVTSVASGPNEDPIANSWLLQVSAIHCPVREQLRRLGSKDAVLSVQLLDILRPGGESEIAQILSKPDATEHELRLALDYVATSMSSCSEELQDRIAPLLTSGTKTLRIASVLAMYAVAQERLCSELLAASWTSDSGDSLDAHYGSLAIIKYGKHLPFEDLATIIAPWRLVEAAQLRGGSKEEFDLAIKAVGQILRNGSGDLDEVGHAELVFEGDGRARIRVTEREEVPSDPFREPTETHSDVSTRMRSFHERITEHIEELRNQGAHLLLHDVDVPSLSVAWDLCSSAMISWLNGADSGSTSFESRLRSADGLFFALCEVLLKKQPTLGTTLWRALSKVLPSRFQGPAGVSGLTHLLFKAPDGAEVCQLRIELLSPTLCRSDASLLDIVIAARMQNAGAWLEAVAADDLSAEHQWRRRRGIVLNGLLAQPDALALNWPAGEPVDTWTALRSNMQIWSNRGALARYWWERYLKASSAEIAYAAFVVFLACADRRAVVWMWDELNGLPRDSELSRLKRLHCVLNKDVIQREMKKKEDEAPKIGGHLYGAGLPREWLTMDGLKFA